MRPKQIVIDLDDADPNGVFVDQQLEGAGDFDLDGAGVVGGVWVTPDGFAKRIGLESSGNMSGVNFTLVGFADLIRNIPVTETLAGANNGTAETVNYFAVITQISADDEVATDLEAGPVDEAVSQIIPLNWRGGNVAINVTVVGTVEYTVQQTFDDFNVGAPYPFAWDDHDDAELVAATATKNGNYIAIPRGMRVKVNSYSTGAALTINVSQSDV